MMSDKTHEFHAVEQQEIALTKALIEENQRILDEKIREQFRTCQECGSKNIEFVGFVKVCNDCGEGVYDLIENNPNSIEDFEYGSRGHFSIKRRTVL